MLKKGDPLPTLPSRQEMRDVAVAWEAFMAGETRGLEQVRPVIRESWQRCQRLGVDPYLPCVPLVLTAEDLEAVQERVDLVEVTTPLFETVIRVWEHEQFMLSVSDHHGRILHTSGHPAALERAVQLNAVPGGGIAEEHVGTASANIVLSQGHADYVMWYEHYCKTFHPWAAIGAPIYRDPKWNV